MDAKSFNLVGVVMKALLKEDKILCLTLDQGVEIGNIPSGVSLERLRWDGSRLVDLFWERTIHVRCLTNGYFELHAVNLPGTYAVAMSYKDRKQLRVTSDGVPFIASWKVVVDEVKVEKIKAAEIKLCSNLGGQQKQLQSLMAFVAALIVYAGEEPEALKNFFEEITPNIKAAYPAGRYLDILRKAGKELKQCLSEYHAEVDRINSE
jgi:hypothetical protein